MLNRQMFAWHITAKVAIYLCLGIAISACSKNKINEEAVPGKFPIILPLVLDTAYTNEYITEIQAVQNIEIRAKVSGFIEKIHVDEGAAVKEGQLLFSLNSRGFQEELQKAQAVLKNAEAELKIARVELKNSKSLVEKNIVSATQYEMAEAKTEAILAKIEEARSAISTATLNLSYTQIKAPFSGAINRIPNKAGSLVDEGSLLTTLSNSKEVFAYFNVSEKEYLEMAAKGYGSENGIVSLLLTNNTPYKYPGTIETVESEIDRSTGNIAFRARFANPEQLLKHGSSGKVLVKNQLEKALLIPQKSTFEIQGNIYVFIVDSTNTVRMRKVLPTIRLEHFYVIGSGISPQDKIIYEGIQRVKDGDQIVPDSVAFPQIPNL